MRRPLIAVSAGFPAYGDYMGLAYAQPLEAVGALPVQLPYLSDAERALDVADGVVLGFGADIDPARYGGAPRRVRAGARARAALAAGVPVLGICRGMQLLCVARGGTLLPDAAPHPGGEWDRWALVREAVLAEAEVPEHPGHPLRVLEGSLLAAAVGVEGVWVNSWHHQAVDEFGSGVVAVAWADDGIVEAVELEGDAWVLGVQWELQESWKDDPSMLRVFEEFVSATARRRAPRAAA